MPVNEDMIAHWNGEATATWVTGADRYDAMLRPLGDAVLDAAGLSPGEAVLDVGCGSGQLTRLAAERVGSAGRVLGVDVAAPLLALARDRTTEPHVEYLQADAQVTAWPGDPFDVVVSRLGVMFFDDPARAFANLAAATRPGGRLAFVCWRGLLENAWALTAVRAVGEHVVLPEPPPPGSPGRFAFADADHVRRVLDEGGWRGVAVEPHDSEVVVYGARTAEEAAQAFVDDSFGRVLTASADAGASERARAALADALRPHERPDGVVLGAATWVVTATRG